MSCGCRRVWLQCWFPASHETQARAAVQSSRFCDCRRAKQEYVREELRDANQARGRGSQMGGPEGGLASVNETEWLSEVRAGRKKAAVLKDAEKVFQVGMHTSHVLFLTTVIAHSTIRNCEYAGSKESSACMRACVRACVRSFNPV